MHKKKLYFFLLIFLNFIYINNSFAVEPYSFVQKTADRASEALNKRQSKEEKMEKLKIIAKETVDIRGIGYYSLGSYRKNISDQKKAFPVGRLSASRAPAFSLRARRWGSSGWRSRCSTSTRLETASPR